MAIARSQAYAKLARAKVANVKADPSRTAARRARLAELEARLTQKAISERAQISYAQLGQWLSGVRNMTEASARKIERALQLPSGFMDQAPTDATGTTTLRVGEPSADEYEIIALWRVLFEDQRTALLATLRTEAERAGRIAEELRKRNLANAVPDGEVAKHLPPRPPQRELPIGGPPPKKPGKK